MRGQLSTVIRTPQYPQLRTAVARGQCHDIAMRVTRGERDTRYPVLKFLNLPRKFLRAMRMRIERMGSQPIGARRATYPQVDATGSDCLEHAELFGHLKSGIMR